jgi:hypothetical protein
MRLRELYLAILALQWTPINEHLLYTKIKPVYMVISFFNIMYKLSKKCHQPTTHTIKWLTLLRLFLFKNFEYSLRLVGLASGTYKNHLTLTHMIRFLEKEK